MDKLVEDAKKDSWHRQLGIIYRGGPDESNSISNWDGCFSEHCQKEFRNYLKTVYGSLEQLNKSWESAYTGWNQIIAMTRDDVKNKHSFAPWLDHRTFNDWNRGRALMNIKKGIKALDPDLCYSLVEPRIRMTVMLGTGTISPMPAVCLAVIPENRLSNSALSQKSLANGYC